MSRHVSIHDLAAQHDDDGDEAIGLICRTCECRHFRVVYTRKVRGGRIMRRRECRNCGRRVTTYESATL